MLNFDRSNVKHGIRIFKMIGYLAVLECTEYDATETFRRGKVRVRSKRTQHVRKKGETNITSVDSNSLY